MSKDGELLNEVIEFLHEDATKFDSPSYDKAIIGYTIDGQLVYDYNEMVKYLIQDEGMTEEDALEWLSYNTIRTLPYMGDYKPIIICRLEEVHR